jgi:tetratricopeptide (TPR) repeat protein
LYTEQLITDFHDVLNPTPRRQAVLQQFEVGSALLHLPTDNDATLNLVDTLAESPDWKFELWDDTGLLFLRGERSEGLTQVRPWRSPSWADAAAAERELTDLIKRRPSATAHRLLSQLLLERGEVAQATAQANQAVTISPYFSAAWSQLGLCYAKAGNLEGVLSASEGALRADGTHAPTRYNRALALLEKSNRVQGLSSSWARWQARYQAQRALWLDPDFTPAQKLLEQL